MTLTQHKTFPTLDDAIEDLHSKLNALSMEHAVHTLSLWIVSPEPETWAWRIDSECWIYSDPRLRLPTETKEDRDTLKAKLVAAQMQTNLPCRRLTIPRHGEVERLSP